MGIPFGHRLSNLPELLENFTENTPARGAVQAQSSLGIGVLHRAQLRRAECDYGILSADWPLGFKRGWRVHVPGAPDGARLLLGVLLPGRRPPGGLALR
jgi:hypothetical protein